MPLSGKIAIVTGGAIRLGRAFAMALSEANAKVVVHYGSSKTAAEETVQEITSQGRDAIAVSADLNDPLTATQNLFEVTHQELGPASILINSAAIFEPAQFAETSSELFDKTWNINFKAPFFLSQKFAEQLPSHESGQIINIVDWRAEKIDRNFLAYSLAKNSLLELTKSLAVELAPRIRVNAIAPGAILPPPGDDESYFHRKRDQIPLQQTGTPNDLVQAMHYLLQSKFVTGEVLHVTGGEHL